MTSRSPTATGSSWADGRPPRRVPVAGATGVLRRGVPRRQAAGRRLQRTASFYSTRPAAGRRPSPYRSEWKHCVRFSPRRPARRHLLGRAPGLGRGREAGHPDGPVVGTRTRLRVPPDGCKQIAVCVRRVVKVFDAATGRRPCRRSRCRRDQRHHVRRLARTAATWPPGRTGPCTSSMPRPATPSTRSKGTRTSSPASPTARTAGSLRPPAGTARSACGRARLSAGGSTGLGAAVGTAWRSPPTAARLTGAAGLREPRESSPGWDLATGRVTGRITAAPQRVGRPRRRRRGRPPGTGVLRVRDAATGAAVRELPVPEAAFAGQVCNSPPTAAPSPWSRSPPNTSPRHGPAAPGHCTTPRPAGPGRCESPTQVVR